MIYALWALVLVVQNASFTWVSRARNSGSDLYHGIAAVFSNGVWFLAFVFTFDLLTQIQEGRGTAFAAAVGAIYVAATVTGSVLGGKVVRRLFEKGARQVGHYDADAEWKAQVTAALEAVSVTMRNHDRLLRALKTAVGVMLDPPVNAAVQVAETSAPPAPGGP